MASFIMRALEDTEYDKLLEATHGDDAIMHWSEFYSWTKNTENRRDIPRDCGVLRGYREAQRWAYTGKNAHDSIYGFRPAFDCITPEELPEDIELGDVIIVGTLCMNCEVVQVRQYDAKTIAKYYEGTTISLHQALDEPDYAVWGVYIGDNVFVADRPLLMKISLSDIESNVKTEIAPVYIPPYGIPHFLQMKGNKKNG